MTYNKRSKMLKISDRDWAFVVVPAFSNNNEAFVQLYWGECDLDKALSPYGISLKSTQLDDGFYRLIVVDPIKWMLSVMKFEFQVN